MRQPVCTWPSHWKLDMARISKAEPTPPPEEEEEEEEEVGEEDESRLRADAAPTRGSRQAERNEPTGPEEKEPKEE
jgi:hypothetical protein